MLRQEWWRSGREVGERLGLHDRPVRLPHVRVHAGHDRDVRVAYEIGAVGGKHCVQRSQDGKEEVIVDLVDLHPLSQDSSLRQELNDALVELLSEEARSTADPRIAGFGEYDVEAFVLV